MKIKYLSHSGFLLTDGRGTQILIDPFLTGNPKAPCSADEVRADYIALTHAHGDHLGDARKIARRCGASFICVHELANILIEEGFQAHGMHIGGAHRFPFGRLKFTIAHHGSAVESGRYAGSPAGALITCDEKTVYHCGDTGLFYDMKLIGEMNRIDLALVPIGDNYTMGIDDAVKAVEFIRPAKAVPMHYNTFPLIAADPLEFQRKTEAAGVPCAIMEPGDTMEL